ncbi:glycosyltransferase, partial [Candidatus Bathyarchaeota archaeon]
MSLVSILIAAYNEKFVIGRTLDTIKSLDYPARKIQVIIADDSTDDTTNVIDKKVGELNSSGIVTLVSRRNNREGFKSGALNHAAPLLRGEYVLLLDADSTVTPGSLSRGLAAFRL